MNQYPDFSKFSQPVTHITPQMIPVYQSAQLAPISVDQTKNLVQSVSPLKIIHNQPQIIVSQPPLQQQQIQQPPYQQFQQQQVSFGGLQNLGQNKQSNSKLKSNTDENFYTKSNHQSGMKKSDSNARFDDDQKQINDQYQGYLEEKQRFLSNPGAVGGAFGSFQQVTSTSRSQQLELELERERNQTQLLSTINNQLQIYIKELEDKFKESLSNNLQGIPQENDEQSSNEEKNQFGKTSSSIYETKIKLLEMENSQLQKVCEQLRTQASDFYEKNTNKEKNTIKNLELEKSYLESTIKLEKMNNQELQAKINMLNDEKQELVLGLEEKINELEVLRNEQEQRLNDEYEKKIIDLEEKANTLLDQNKKIMNINDNLLQEIEALKNANEVMRQNHFNQTEEIKQFWKKQLEQQQNKYNEQSLLQSIAFETSLAKNQSHVQELQTKLANEQSLTQKAKDDLNNYVLRFQDLEDKLNMMLIGNEQLMQVAEMHQEEIKKWKSKYNQANDTFNAEVEKMKQKIQDETQENYKVKLKDKIESIENEKHKLNLRIQDLEMEKIQFQQDQYNLQQKINELELKNLDYNKTKLDQSTSIQKMSEMEYKFNQSQQQLKQAEQNLQKFDKNFQIIINENEKLSKALEQRLSEVQIWQTKYNTLQGNLEENIKKLSNELEDRFQLQCSQIKDENEQLLNSTKQKLEQVQENAHQKEVEIKQLQMILDQRDKEINSALNDFHQLKQKSEVLETQLTQKAKEIESLMQTISTINQAKEDLQKQEQQKFQGSAQKQHHQQQQQIEINQQSPPPKIIISPPTVIREQVVPQQVITQIPQVIPVIREQIVQVPVQSQQLQQSYANPTPIFTNYQQQSEFEIHQQNINLIQQENQMLRDQQNLLKDQLRISKSQKNIQQQPQPIPIITTATTEIIPDKNLIIEYNILQQKYDDLRHEKLHLETIIQNLNAQNQDYQAQILNLQAHIEASNLRARDKDEVIIHNVQLEKSMNDMTQQVFHLEQNKKQLEETIFRLEIEKRKSEDQVVFIENEKQRVISILQAQNEQLNLTVNEISMKANHNDNSLITQIKDLQKENIFLKSQLSSHQKMLEEMELNNKNVIMMNNNISHRRYMSPPPIIQERHSPVRGGPPLFETKRYFHNVTQFPATSSFSIFQENDKLNQQILNRCQRIIQNK